nr:hypothetical protein Iba_chr04aCG6780 [Ipomoea batatas]
MLSPYILLFQPSFSLRLSQPSFSLILIHLAQKEGQTTSKFLQILVKEEKQEVKSRKEVKRSSSPKKRSLNSIGKQQENGKERIP